MTVQMRVVLAVMIASVAFGVSTTTASAQTTEVAQSTSSKLRFAIALVQDLETYKEPALFDSGVSFKMPILKPHQIVAEQCLGGSGRTCRGGNLWYRVERPSGSGMGWVRKEHVALWNHRHALMPSTAADGRSVPAYCTDSSVQESVEGVSEPCMAFNSKLLDRAGTRAPFPVFGTKKFRSRKAGSTSKRFFKVLVPTLYSNIAPIASGNASVGTNTLEVIIAIDATGSMAEQITATTDAIKKVIATVSGMQGLDAKFLVLAYRDTDGADAECPNVFEATGGSRLAFVSAAEAQEFLGGLKACKGGDAPEALWDALYLLKDLAVTPAARRALILVGDAPALLKTRGSSGFGTTVPPGLDRDDVFREVSSTLGSSTEFLAYLVKPGLKKTAEDIMTGFDFYKKRLVTAASPEEVDSEMVEFLTDAVESTGVAAKSIASCEKQLHEREDDVQVGFFCGDASDSELSARVADLVQTRRTKGATQVVVIREAWVPETQQLDNVALLSQTEAERTANALGKLAREIDGAGGSCKGVGADAWIEVMDSIVPGQRVKVGGGKLIRKTPPIGRHLHEYWGLNVRGGSSIIEHNPSELALLEGEECLALRDRLAEASQELTSLRELYRAHQFLWLSFEAIP